METKLTSKKRKHFTSPSDPFEGIFIRRRSKKRNKPPIEEVFNEEINIDRISVKDLRARRVLSPASISDAKGSIEEGEIDEKKVQFDLGVCREDQKIGGNSKINDKKVEFDLGFGKKDQKSSGNTEVDGKKEEFDVGFSKKDQKNIGNIEIESLCDRGLVQTTPPDTEIFGNSAQNTEMDRIVENPLNEERVYGKDSCVGEGERDKQCKYEVKSGIPVSCSRMKLFKTPSSFSYRRLLPFLTGLAKDNSNALEIQPCQKVNKSVGERSSPSLSASENIFVDGSDGEVLSSGHPIGGSDASSTLKSTEVTSSTGSYNVECSTLESPPHTVTESTTRKPPKAFIVSRVNGLMIKKPPQLYGGSAPRVQQDIPNRSKTLEPAHDATNQPVKTSSSLVTPEPSSGNKDTELSGKVEFNVGFCQEDQKSCENPEIESSCEGEWFKLTPPDDKVFCKSKQGMGMGMDRALENPLNNEKVCDKGRCIGDGEKDTHSKSKAKLGFLVPCSRTKLFKTPSSFSYRRLLPYLMDLAEEDSSNLSCLPDALETCQRQKVEKSLEERSPSSLPASQGNIRDGHNKEDVTIGYPFGSSDASPTLKSSEMASPTGSSNVDCPNFESPENRLIESAIQNPPEISNVFMVNSLMITNPPHLYGENASKVQQGMLDKSNKVELAHGATCFVHETNPVVNSSSSLVHPGEDTTRGPLLPEVVDDCSVLLPKTSIDIKPPGVVSMSKEPSNVESPPLEKFLCGPSKGILKRYPRGCRGLCTCLNCASFHLHAERAFEFSRNQMKEAEEVAMELMKELSFIRRLLEKSIDGADCRAVVQVPQVKEACRKASKAEDLAKSYLKQMIHELDIHCRTPCLQRPRVRFAEMLMDMPENHQTNSVKNATDDIW